MASAPRPKASDKQGICKKLVGVLKKRYKSLPPIKERPVLETMLYAVCLENATVEQADAAFERLYALFHDLNEIRVSSVTELTEAFAGMSHPEWRAVQVRGVLQYVFEKNFAFEFESLRKKTLELAQKQLSKIRDLSNFARGWALQEALGSHVVPMDAAMTRACIFLGLADVGSNEEQASAAMRPVLRKNESQSFCELLRAFGTDPAVQKTLERTAHGAADDYELSTAPARLTRLLEDGDPVSSKADKSDAKAGKRAAAKADNGEKPSKSAAKAADKPTKPSKKAEEAPKSARPRSRSN